MWCQTNIPLNKATQTSLANVTCVYHIATCCRRENAELMKKWSYRDFIEIWCNLILHSCHRSARCSMPSAQMLLGTWITRIYVMLSPMVKRRTRSSEITQLKTELPQWEQHFNMLPNLHWSSKCLYCFNCPSNKSKYSLTLFALSFLCVYN